jgi:hypothetical protein
MLAIPEEFKPYFGKDPEKITLRTYNRCNWDITMRIVDGKAVLDQGWPTFTIAHDLRVGYMLTFKKISTIEYHMAIFDYCSCEVVTNSPAHGYMPSGGS